MLLAERLLENKCDAEDIIQEVFLKWMLYVKRILRQKRYGCLNL